MKSYRVECHGDVREVYIVDAENADEAMKNWATGDLVLSEASSVEPLEATQED